MGGRFGAIDSSLQLASYTGIRRNFIDDGFETFDTRAQVPLFESFIERPTTATTEQTLHYHNLPKATFRDNGDRVFFNYVFTTDSSGGDVYARVKFAGTTLIDTGADVDPSAGPNNIITISGFIVRINTTSVRYFVRAEFQDAVTTKEFHSKTGVITGLTLPDPVILRAGSAATGTAYELLATGTSSDNAGDLAIVLAEATYVPSTKVSLMSTSLWAYGEARYYKGAGDGIQYSDNANITTDWQDLSGNGRHLVRTGTPTYQASECNGEGIVRMPGGSVYFTGPNMSTGASGLTEATLLLVLKITDPSPNAGHQNGSYGGTDSYYPYTPDTPDSIADQWCTTALKSCGSTMVDVTQFHTMYVWSKASDWGMLQNNMPLYSTSSNTYGGATAPKFFHNGAAGMIGDIVAWYIYGNKPTDVNRSKQMRYVQQEFGL